MSDKKVNQREGFPKGSHSAISLYSGLMTAIRTQPKNALAEK